MFLYHSDVFGSNCFIRPTVYAKKYFTFVSLVLVNPAKVIEISEEKRCFAIMMSKQFCNEVMYNERCRCQNSYFGAGAGIKLISREGADIKLISG